MPKKNKKSDFSKIIKLSKSGNYQKIPDLLKKIIKSNKEGINIVNGDGESLLTIAARKNDIKFVEILIKNGANINLANKNSNTPLMGAIHKRNIEVIKFLLEQYPNLELKNNLGNTALLAAIHTGNEQIINLLISYGANPEAINNDGQTPITIGAIYFDRKNIGKIFNKALEEKDANSIMNLFSYSNILFPPFKYEYRTELTKFVLDRAPEKVQILLTKNYQQFPEHAKHIVNNILTNIQWQKLKIILFYDTATNLTPIKKAIQIDPISLNILSYVGWDHNWGEKLALIKKFQILPPEHPINHQLLITDGLEETTQTNPNILLLTNGHMNSWEITFTPQFQNQASYVTGKILLSPLINYLDDQITLNSPEKPLSQYYSLSDTLRIAILIANSILLSQTSLIPADQALISKLVSDLAAGSFDLSIEYIYSLFFYTTGSFIPQIGTTAIMDDFQHNHPIISGLIISTAPSLASFSYHLAENIYCTVFTCGDGSGINEMEL